MYNPIMETKELKLGIFDQAPRATKEIAYIADCNGDKPIAITFSKPVLASKLRSRKYNHITGICMAPYHKKITERIKEKEGKYEFIIEIDLSVKVKDPLYVWENERTDIVSDVYKLLSGIIVFADKKYDITEEITLKQYLNNEFNKILERLQYLDIYYSVEVRLEEKARNLLDKITKNDMEMVINDKEHEKNLQIQILRQEIELLKKNNKSELDEQDRKDREKAMAHMAKMRVLYGDDSIYYGALLGGEINNSQLGEKFRENRERDLEMKLHIIKELADSGVMTEAEISKFASNVIFNIKSSDNQLDEKKQERIEEVKDRAVIYETNEDDEL